ncbi:MAG: lipopolysaccharide biosynthesis protein [Kiritimatiellia bacterium]
MSVDTHKTFRSASAGVLMRILRYPFFLLFLVWVPREMGPVTYGKFAVFLSVYMMLEPFVGLGNIQIFGRFLPEHLQDPSKRGADLLHGMLFYGTLVTLGVLGIALFGFQLFLPADFSPRWFVILALILLLGKWQGTFFAYLYGLNQLARFSSRDLIRSASRVVLVVLLYRWRGLEGALWAFVGNEILLVTVSGFWVRRELFQVPRWPAWQEFGSYITFGLKFHVPTCFQALLERSGNVLITLLAPLAASDLLFQRVTNFDISNQFLLMTTSFFGIFLATLVPSLTRMHLADEQQRILEWLNNVLSYCAALCVVVILTLICLGRNVLPLLGEGFEGVYPSAVLLSLAFFPVLVNQVGSNLSVVRKEPSVFILGISAGLIGMLLFAWLQVPRWLELGFVLATVLGYSVTSLVFLVKYFEVYRCLLRRLGQVLLAGLCTVPFCFWLPADLLPRILFWLTLWAWFLLLLLLQRVITREHSREVLTILRGKKPGSGPAADLQG